MSAESLIRGLLEKAGIAVDGSKPWDIQVHDRRLFDRVLAQGSLGLGEAYMDGWWDCEQLDGFFHRVVDAHLDSGLSTPPAKAWMALQAWLLNRQSRARAWRVAQVHYDLDVDVFQATFDRRLTGSCGYWRDARNLDDAQEAKLDLICRKLKLEAGQRVLDIGCGWGAFIGYATKQYGVSGVGITVSQVQALYARGRYAGLPADFQVMDYRAFEGQVDHIASMGMFEHVGSKNYRTYFQTARRALRPGGLFVLHTIWTNERSATIDPWLDRYIFPNGVLPTVGQVGAAVEGLFVIEDVENFGADYDLTLMAWYDNFQSHRERLAARYGERFCRMWDYYLRCCAGGFRSRSISVGQFVLSPDGVPGGWRLDR
ncbi:MAG: cyclopropane fatty acyl phospholipid synthase [Caulobacteraceae bacterium]|nr:cyclopropane fatty acyl phospholipid synthase [Caulobacteraceae bacterium]